MCLLDPSKAALFAERGSWFFKLKYDYLHGLMSNECFFSLLPHPLSCFCTGLQHQGIFRVPGSQLEVNDIKNSFERGTNLLHSQYSDLLAGGRNSDWSKYSVVSYFLIKAHYATSDCCYRCSSHCCGR